jgi:flagellin
MRINYNISAGIANKHLLGIESSLSDSMERLSSGLKINHAKDNPAGIAISKKMQAQIDGLDRASQNASDGVSVIQIADGALNEVTSILQRMRELSVQAASDATMSAADKDAIQKEISSLKDEIDRISTDTEYNTKTLLNGDLDTRVYTKNASRVQISDEVVAGKYGITITDAATQAAATAGTDFTQAGTVGVSGTISINGSDAVIEATDTYEEAYEKIRDAAAIGDASATRNDDGTISFTSTDYGKEAILDITFSNENLANWLGLQDVTGTDASGATVTYTLTEDPDNAGTWFYGYLDSNDNKMHPAGADMEWTDLKGFSSSATVATTGNRVTVTDIGGASFSFLADAGYEDELNFEVTEIGQMVLHIGANMDQNMSVRIPEVSTSSLYIDDLDVDTVSGADKALEKLDDAIAYVSSVRSRLGAYENRLEYSVNSLDAFGENMTDAISRLTDVDMAEEMTNYTHLNVLNQAAISVLTQANELPQQVLQILQ